MGYDPSYSSFVIFSKPFIKKCIVFIFSFLFLFILSSRPAHAYTSVSGNISTNTTWVTGEVYRVTGGTTVDSGVTLRVQPGAIVKFDSGTSLTVNGELAAYASSGNKTFFTSVKDDTVGGDTDGVSDTPAAGNWVYIQFNNGASASFEHSIIRFGGSGGGVNSLLYGNGGTVNLINSTVASGSNLGIWTASGSLRVENSIIKDTTNKGVLSTGVGSTTLINNTFIDNADAAGYIDLSSGKAFSSSGNTASGGGKRGFFITGSMSSNQTWTVDVPYIVYSDVTVPSGKQLTVQPGAIVKFNSNSRLVVNGELSSIGTSGSQIYFTSIEDDSIGGNTDNEDYTPGNNEWAQIEVNSGSSVSMSYANIKHGGSGASINAGVYANGGTLTISNSTVASSSNGFKITSGTVSIVNCTIKDTTTNGVTASGAGTLTLTSNTFIDNANAAASIDLSSGKAFTSSGNSASGSGMRGFLMYGPVDANQTWGSGAPYIMDNLVTVNSGKTLTISPGAILKFQGGGRITVEGTLSAVGTSGSNIYFTSLKDDSAGGDTNNDNGGTTPDKNNWAHLRFNTGSIGTISYSKIRFGGNSDGGSDTNGNIFVSNGTLTLTNSTIASASHGFRIASGSVTIEDSAIKDNNVYGVFAYGPGSLTLEDNTFADNGTAPTYIDTSSGKTVNLGGNIVQGGSQQGLVFNGDTINTNQTWGAGTYVIGSSGLTVASGKMLSINSGAIIKFDGSSAKLTVNGIFDADGTSNQPIYFTSIEDDSRGGDTNGDGPSTAESGDWAYLRFNTGSSSSFDYSIIEFGGSSGGNNSMVYVSSGSLVVNNSYITSSSDKGMRVDSGIVNIHSSNINGNGEGIVVNNTGQVSISESLMYNNSTVAISNISSYEVEAENNHWGHSTGPYNLASNPSGLGNAASNNVDFNPWHYTKSLGSVSNGQIKYTASTSYNGQWEAAVAIWNDEGLVNISSNSFDPDLEVVQVDLATPSWLGYWNPVPDPDVIQVDVYHMADMDDNDGRLNVFLHELGHALGLGHSESGNVMYEHGGDGYATELGPIDLADYHFWWEYWLGWGY